jgi:hypothetical protein
VRLGVAAGQLASPGDAAAYRDFMAGYVAEQRKLGRFHARQSAAVRHDLMERTP